MKAKDFEDFSFSRLKASDITATGAPLDTVNLFLAIAVDRFISATGLPVVLLPNGLTTGVHRASWHPRGLAADVAFNCDQSSFSIYDVWKQAVDCRFKGIGVYWNGIAYSLHLDLRPKLSLWGATKTSGSEWRYLSVFLDPKSA